MNFIICTKKLSPEEIEELKTLWEKTPGKLQLSTGTIVQYMAEKIPTRHEAAEVMAAMAERVPDDDIRDHQMLRAVLFMTAGILDQATDNELIKFAAFIQHFGELHCAAFKDEEENKSIN